MSAVEVARFLTKLEAGFAIGDADLADAKAIGFGGTGPMSRPGAVGPVWGKNGGAHGAASQAMVYPGTQGFLTRNSTGNDAQVVSDSAMLTAGWTAALVGPASELAGPGLARGETFAALSARTERSLR